jgi:hypothetical protein
LRCSRKAACSRCCSASAAITRITLQQRTMPAHACCLESSHNNMQHRMPHKSPGSIRLS